MRNRAVMSHRTLRPAFRGRRLPPPSPLPLGIGSRCRPARETSSRRGRQRGAGCVDQSGRRGRKGRQKALKAPPLRTSRRAAGRAAGRQPGRLLAGVALWGDADGAGRAEGSGRSYAWQQPPCGSTSYGRSYAWQQRRPAAAPAQSLEGGLQLASAVPEQQLHLAAAVPGQTAALGSSLPRAIGIGVRGPAGGAASAAIGPYVRVNIVGTKIARAQRRRRGSGRTCKRWSTRCSSSCSRRQGLEWPRCWRRRWGQRRRGRKQRRRSPCPSLRAMVARMRRHEAACIAFSLWSCRGVCHVCFGAGPGVPWEHSLLSAGRRGSQAGPRETDLQRPKVGVGCIERWGALQE